MNIDEGKQKRQVDYEKGFSYWWERVGTLLIFLLLFIIIAIISPSKSNFLSLENIINILYQSADKIVIGLGVFFAILIGGIDLSIGSVMALTGLWMGMLMKQGIPVSLAILLGAIIGGGLLGAMNGLLINLSQVHPFIITLGTQWIYRGIVMILSNARSVSGFPQSFKMVVNYRVIGMIPTAVIIALLLAVILWIITTKMKMGRNIYAFGGNPEAAWYSGIDTNVHRLVVFIISGICAGIGGLIITAKTGAAEPLAGSGYETFAIAAAVIGGTSFFGGKGKVWNVVIGGLIIGLINNGLNMMRVDTFYQQVVMGVLIISAVTMDTLLLHKKKK
ncbi:MAG: D-allose ABC transporter permease [Saccharofermentanales bacterium]|jgi:D-allose transport system permease protein